MKVGADSAGFKTGFGEFLAQNRAACDWSVYDVGRMLGVSQQTVFLWEQGVSFPGSIVKLKKLCLIYDGVPDKVKSLAEEVRDSIGDRKLGIFLNEVYAPTFGEMQDELECRYVPVDARDMRYKIAFGRYMREERMARCIPLSGVANALGISVTNVLLWESGTSFPQSVVMLSMLDWLYGEVFDVIFGLCRENGIHLDRGEVRKVLVRKKALDGKGRWSPEKVLGGSVRAAAIMGRRR